MHTQTHTVGTTGFVDRPLCALDPSVELIGQMTRSIFGGVDCPSCLRRAIAEAEERVRALRDLLGNVEVLS
jgi:hypothetical protein